MQLTDNSLVLCIVAGEIRENVCRAGHNGSIIGTQKQNQLSQEVIKVVLCVYMWCLCVGKSYTLTETEKTSMFIWK